MKKKSLIQKLPLLGFDYKSYLSKILSTERENLIGCWLQNEPFGPISYDHSGLGHNGAFAGGLRFGQSGVPGMGMTSTLFAEATENLVTNSSFEIDTTGFAAGGNTTIARSTEQAKFGSASLKVTSGANLEPDALSPMTITAAAHAGSVWMYIPTSYSGTAIELEFPNWTGSARTDGVADMTIRDSWQLVVGYIFPVGGDLVGFFRVREAAGDAADGDFFYVDGCQLEAKAYPTPTTIGDMGTGFAWTGAAHASTSTRAGTYNNIYSPDLANPNLLLNPGFETAGGGDPDFFANWEEAAGAGAIADEGVVVHEGSHAVKFTGAAGTRVTQDVPAVVPSTRYRFRFWTQGDGTNAGMYRVYDKTNIADIIATTTTGVTGAAYTMVTQEFTTPATCEEVRVYCYSPPTGVCYFDACEVRRMDGFLGDEGMLLVWSRVPASVWTDATGRSLAIFEVDASNFVNIRRQTTDNLIALRYGAGGVTKQFVTTAITDTYFHAWVLTWSKSQDEVRGYVDGQLIGSSPLSSLGTWTGNLTKCIIGAVNLTPVNVWFGNNGPVALWNKVPDTDQIKRISMGSGWEDIYYGGATYSAGQGIISLRFDDWHAGDISYIIPELSARGLLAGFGIPSDFLDAINRGTTQDAINTQAAGHEILCHSKTHGVDPINNAELIVEIIDSVAALRAIGLNIDSFTQPGTWTGAYKINSSAFWGTYIDYLIRSKYACYEAYINLWDTDNNKRSLPIPERNRFGQQIVGGYSLTLVQLQTLIDECIANGEGTEIIFHYSNIGDTISAADFESFLDYVETKEIAGDIVVMTPTQQLFAQPV